VIWHVYSQPKPIIEVYQREIPSKFGMGQKRQPLNVNKEIINEERIIL